MRLFSYCIPVDDGAAPNPFWGICTLTICKPVIRRVAKVGDWIAGVGSMRMGYAGQLVYAMKVSDVKTLREYDDHCRKHLLGKIPDISSTDFRRLVGDCIYDFSGKKPIQRRGVHNENNIPRDLGGSSSLLSDHFYYFGDNAIDIPSHLTGIIRQGQGHRSTSNESLKNDFVDWIESVGERPNVPHGNPQYEVTFREDNPCKCGSIRSVCHEEDEVILESDC